MSDDRLATAEDFTASTHRLVAYIDTATKRLTRRIAIGTVVIVAVLAAVLWVIEVVS